MAMSMLPVVLPSNGDDPRQIGAGEVLDGNCNDLVLVARQAGAGLTLLTSDTVVDGSNYLWESIILPFGRVPYFEVVAAGLNLGAATGITVGLYTLAGVLVANSALTITSATPLRSRSAALTLVNGTEYVVKYRTSGLLGSSFIYSARILLR